MGATPLLFSSKICYFSGIWEESVRRLAGFVLLCILAFFWSPWKGVCDETHPLFHIERSKNKNIVQYDFHPDEGGHADGRSPDEVYWILETQNQDGSWGYYVPTAEETAYCLQALVSWKRHGGQVPGDALKRGATWLADHTEPPYAPLWIGKCLYCPVLVVRSAILSALMLVVQEG